ncbi:putative PLAC8 motif-containing protein [Medicago truncatula]|uniref:Putative PLAC8 motif-containing protein n=1 Tax=Medicago truncatula TaxID=3880 RepID=A0A396H300_MEDTR|nr:putative PLAC8 motif-containing protein [Medicago truncatula]
MCGDNMGDNRSRYVKLTKDKEQAPFQDITPGELNQPIDIQLNTRRCLECGQVLPEAYQPPADEDWTTGICGCVEDTDSCKISLFFRHQNLLIYLEY